MGSGCRSGGKGFDKVLSWDCSESMKSVGYTADRLGARSFLPVLPGAGQEMPTIRTKKFGSIDYDDADIFEFPAGLPGFEAEQRFLCIERPALRPVAFLQSVSNPELCFITLPARSIIRLTPELRAEEGKLRAHYGSKASKPAPFSG